MKHTIKNIVEGIENSPTKRFIGLLVFLISAILVIVSSVGTLINFYYQKVQWKQQAYELIKSLAADVNIGYFESRLGGAAFINVSEKTDIKEYVFIDKNYYVDVIIDKNGKVLMYSVTTRSKTFNPTTPEGEIVLGKTRFVKLVIDDFFGEPDEVISVLGAHDYFYTEGYYWGNPMNYQTYYYSNSDAGYNDYDDYDFVIGPDYIPDYIENGQSRTFEAWLDEAVSDSGPKYKKDKEIMKFRLKNTNLINTYTVTAPFVTIGDIAEFVQETKSFYFLGPDKNQVRVAP